MASCSAREAAIRASDLAFQRLHGREYLRGDPYDLIGPREIGPWQYIAVISPEEAENAELEDDDVEDETEERVNTRKIRTTRHVLASTGR